MKESFQARPNTAQPHVIIVGGGFGGLAAARALKPAPVRVTLEETAGKMQLAAA